MGKVGTGTAKESSVTKRMCGIGPLVFSVVFCLLSRGSYTRKPAPLVGSEEIPSGYDSYSLFLICNPEWLPKTHEDSPSL